MRETIIRTLVGEAKRLSESVPVGPWTLAAGDVYQQTGARLDDPLATTMRAGKEGLAILEFIARARTLLPELAQENELLRETLRLREESQIPMVPTGAQARLKELEQREAELAQQLEQARDAR